MKSPKNKTRRSTGKTPIPARCGAWMLRHPGISTTPAALGAGVLELGPVTTGTAVAGLVSAGLSWRYLHKETRSPHMRPRGFVRSGAAGPATSGSPGKRPWITAASHHRTGAPGSFGSRA